MRVILLGIINMMVKYINRVSEESVVIKKEWINIVSGCKALSLHFLKQEICTLEGD